MPDNLHAKLGLIDNESFSIGSPNIDYRSFRYQHEIVLTGSEISISKQLREHVDEIIKNSEMFDYDKWLSRSWIQKFFEKLLLPFRHFL